MAWPSPDPSPRQGGRGGQTDDQVIVALRPAGQEAHSELTILADYAHLDRWTVSASPAICRW